MPSNLPTLVIDDDPEQVRGILHELLGGAEIIHPRDLTAAVLSSVSLLLIDHQLKVENWPELKTFPLACRPHDGLALAGNLQSYLRSLSRLDSPPRPVAVALLSGRLTDVTGLANPSEHIAARSCGLDWAFAKAQNPTFRDPLSARIASVAGAVRALPLVWPSSPDAIQEKLGELLRIDPEAAWAGIARLHVDRCHPPVHEPAFWSHGTAMLRWLAQQVLPYRTFLMDADHLAIRLGVSPRWLARWLEDRSPLFKSLSPALYQGILKELLGARWWVAGVDSLLWNLPGGSSGGMTEIQAWLETQTGEAPEVIGCEETLVLTEALAFDGRTASFQECVRVWPDDWPTFAEVPWITLASAFEYPHLRALVLASDLERLDSHEA